MTKKQNQKPELPELQELAPLIDAGKWDDVDKVLDADYAAKLEREKTYKGVLENDARTDALDQTLLKATDADRPGTVARVLRIQDFGVLTIMEARHNAGRDAKFQALGVLDRFVDCIIPEFRKILDGGGGHLAPLTKARLQANRLKPVRRTVAKKRPERKTPRP